MKVGDGGYCIEQILAKHLKQSNLKKWGWMPLPLPQATIIVAPPLGAAYASMQQ